MKLPPPESITTTKSGGLITDPKRVSLYLSQTRLPRLSESNGGQGLGGAGE